MQAGAVVTSGRTIDVTGLENWIASVPHQFDVVAWRYEGLDLWPLFKTALVGLAVLEIMGHRRYGLATGGMGWQLGVVADYFASPIVRNPFASLRPSIAPPKGLSDSVLCYDSGGHARQLGDLLVSPSLDVLAALLGRTGRRSVFWFENSSGNDPRLRNVLHGPAYGMAELLADARKRAVRFGTQRAMNGFPGFAECCEVAARYLEIPLRFLKFWITRQVNLAISFARSCDHILVRHGCPELLLVSNSCVWTTTGLIGAAKWHGVPVIEVHHGAESPSAITAPGQVPHFSRFNTAPDALITWEELDRSDERAFAAGPLSVQLGQVISARQSSDPESYDRFLQLLERQRAALARHVKRGTFAAEVAVSLQPGDEGGWLRDIVRELGGKVFFWVRRHAKDSHKPIPAPANELAACAEYDLATSTFLPILLERVDIHLTRFSAVTLEAAGMGVPTIATDPYAADLYDWRLPNGTFWIRQTTRAVTDQIETLIAEKTRKPGTKLSDLSCLIPFVENVCRSISAGEPIQS